jgi:hypothetical protein
VNVRLTKRQRRQAVKADLLDRFAQDAASFTPEPSHGLTASEVADVYEKLSAQLYAWAVRITPPLDEG